MENKMQVKDLRVSFRTNNGKVQAVRGISFDLAEGETLAIVGESGSGKSVTSKAILGIQANNAITESGEIIYDGKDLLKISEDDFHKIRGDKISMIFQDPMSSLNPIVKIGVQLTEAMLLKGKAKQKESRANFQTYLSKLEKLTCASLGSDEAAKTSFSAQCKIFNDFEIKHVQMEIAYNRASEAAHEAVEDIQVLVFELEKKAAKDVKYRVKDICGNATKSIHEYMVCDEADQLKRLCEKARGQIAAIAKGDDATVMIQTLCAMQDILQRALDMEAPNLFNLAGYTQISGQPAPNAAIAEMNSQTSNFMEEKFMTEFSAKVKHGLQYSSELSFDSMKKAIPALQSAIPIFQKNELNKAECNATLKRLSETVDSTIDPLAIVKDSLSFTFNPGLKDEIARYFSSFKKNRKAQRVHDRQQRKYDRIVASGKVPDWKVAEASVIDQELLKSNMVHLIERQVEHYEQLLAHQDERDYDKETLDAISYLKANAKGQAAKVTKRIAKDRAIKLMEEVGIAEPRKRYNQYPFEFSGGMRQRIVIAIALAANPDILICDEPTTALDVTIQSQILELINKLKAERNLSIIFITHDLGVVANMADRVAVMYAGKIVEYGTAEEIFYDPRHPYTWALLSSMPDLDTKEKLEYIPGTPPNMIYPPKGDAFAARNKYAMAIDFEEEPPMFKVSDTHYAATWLLHPDAPKLDRPQIITNRIERMKIKRGENK